jgi:hypothetical protein
MGRAGKPVVIHVMKETLVNNLETFGKPGKTLQGKY